MADEDFAAAIADIQGESPDEKHPIDIDVPAFAAGTADAADSNGDGETSTTDGRDDIAVGSFSDTTGEPGTGPQPIDGYRAEWRPSGVASDTLDSNDLVANADAGPELQQIGGYQAEWRPSGGASDGASDTFDATDLRAVDVSYGAGATDAQLHIADDVKYSDDATGPWGDGTHEVDIGGNLDEPTEIWLGPAESPPDDGAVTEVSDTDAPLAATDSTKFEDVD